MLQGRTFPTRHTGQAVRDQLYPDSDQCTRSGPFHHFQQDGTWHWLTKGRQHTNPVLKAVRANRTTSDSARLPQMKRAGKFEIVESFADHYSQARQFYISQTKTDRSGHRRIIFELSKVESPRSACDWYSLLHRRQPADRRWIKFRDISAALPEAADHGSRRRRR
jgi:catalase